jgi:hypothetical protein
MKHSALLVRVLTIVDLRTIYAIRVSIVHAKMVLRLCPLFRRYHPVALARAQYKMQILPAQKSVEVS